MYQRLLLIIALIATPFSVFADTTLEMQDAEITAAMEKLDKINYLPNLLPIILANTDFIGLNDDQVAELKQWRRDNVKPMLAAMRKITSKRIAIKQAALDANINADEIRQMQSEIFELHRTVIDYKLSCREHVTQTFTRENWGSFFMVLADHDIGVTLPVNFAKQSVAE